LTNGNLEFPEGAFIKPTTKQQHKFLCAVCRSMRLRVDFNPYKGELTISCDDCGNFTTMNFALGNEVPDGG
jgi:hypothetical protein